MTIKPYQCHLVKTWNFFSPMNPLTSGKGANLDPQSLLEAAVKESGHSDFGDSYFLEPFGVFLSSLEETGKLHSFGRFYVRKMMISFLVNRLNLVNLWKTHPEILQEKIESPIIILGLPRTGTTYLFKSLSQNPDHRYLSNWETTVSQTPPNKITKFEDDPRRKVGRRLNRFQEYLAPQLRDIHSFGLDGPEECTPLLLQSFISSSLPSMFNVPKYAEWLKGAYYKDSYAFYKKMLQTLQWAYPKKRWLLKSPNHIEAVKDLLELFPDACIVQTHRDLGKVLPSYSSLCLAFRSICQSNVNLNEIGEQSLQILSDQMNRYLKDRNKCDSHRFLDVQYDDLIKSPTGTLHKIYQNFKIPLSQEARRRTENFAKIQKTYSSKHSYCLHNFGLNLERVESRFKSYTRKYLKPVLFDTSV